MKTMGAKKLNIRVYKPTFALGAAQVLDVTGAYAPKVIKRSQPAPASQDGQQLAQDWERVGDSFRQAMKRVTR